MVEKLTNEQKVLIRLFKDLEENYNSRNLGKKIGISHAGTFKILKSLEKENFVVGKTIGRARIYAINFKNALALKKTDLALMQESFTSPRWLEEFRDFENLTEFVIIFGSILKNPKAANDVDLLLISKEENLQKVRITLKKKKEISSKEIHALIQSKEDFNRDLNEKNKVTLEILKTGIILYGQDNLIKSFGIKNGAFRK
jgi:hypothetical protein